MNPEESTVVAKERTIGHRTERGTEWPIYLQLIRTYHKEGSLLRRRRMIYEVKCVYRDMTQWRRQFTTLREATRYYVEWNGATGPT